MREKRNAYRVLVEKPAGNRPPWRSRRRWDDNIKIDLRVIGWSGMNWICLSQNRDQCKVLVNMVTIVRFPWNAERLQASQEGLGCAELISLPHWKWLNLCRWYRRHY
jgi:hypothetical protein